MQKTFGYIGFAFGLIGMLIMPKTGPISGGIIGAILGGGGFAFGAAIGASIEAFVNKPDQLADGGAAASICGLGLGILSLPASILPIFGLPASILGLILCHMSKASRSRGVALAGIVCSSLGLCLSVCFAYFGAFAAMLAMKG